jgi:hypothetical protein
MSNFQILQSQQTAWRSRTLIVDESTNMNSTSITVDNTGFGGVVSLTGLEVLARKVGYNVRIYNRGSDPVKLVGASAEARTADQFSVEASVPGGGSIDLTYNGLRWVPITSGRSSDPTAVWELFEDFDNVSVDNYNRLAAAGGGTGQSWSDDFSPLRQPPNAWGVIQANHGTGTTSRLDLVCQSPQGYYLRLGKGVAYEYSSRFQFANLSSAGNRYIGFDGFFDADTTDPTFNRGILFRYSDDINSGKFQCVCRSAAGPVETLVDSGITPVIDTWYVLAVRVNALATEAVFAINGAVVATITTNIVSGDANPYTAEHNNDRTTGSTNFVSRRVDYMRLRATGLVASRGF